MGSTRTTITANGIDISITSQNNAEDYISLTDIARYKSDEPAAVISNWMRNKDTIAFLGLWEELNNPDFKPLEFEQFKREAGSNAFALSPQKWITTTNAIGIISKSGRYGGTYAHKDIAFEFASWVSPEFKLYVIKEYQRLKERENNVQALDWNLKRELAKINYKIHTDAIKEHLVPPTLSHAQRSVTYANEADLLNVALFGMTAREWKTRNPNTKGNMRDNASLHQLIVLSNLESLNAHLIKQNIPQAERLTILNLTAIEQMTSLLDTAAVNRLDRQVTLPINND